MLTIRLAAAALAATLGAGPVAAAPFTLFIHETQADLALRTDAGEAGRAYWSGYAALGKEMAAAGILRGGSALQPETAAIALRVTDGGPVTSASASTPESGLWLGGYFLIDVPDIAAARAWAARVPAARTGLVEIRPAYPVPGM